MTNTALLREKIDESGYKLRFVAKKIGITYQGFLKKINNESEFKASEIQGLKELFEPDWMKKGIRFFFTLCVD